MKLSILCTLFATLLSNISAVPSVNERETKSIPTVSDKPPQNQQNKHDDAHYPQKMDDGKSHFDLIRQICHEGCYDRGGSEDVILYCLSKCGRKRARKLETNRDDHDQARDDASLALAASFDVSDPCVNSCLHHSSNAEAVQCIIDKCYGREAKIANRANIVVSESLPIDETELVANKDRDHSKPENSNLRGSQDHFISLSQLPSYRCISACMIRYKHATLEHFLRACIEGCGTSGKSESEAEISQA